MTFQKEADFEEALIKVLADKGWEKEVIKNPTEQDLIRNWAKILFDNNRGIDRLNNYPLTDGEMQQIIEQITELRTPLKLNGFINGKTVSIKRDNPDDKLHFGTEISLKIYDRREIAAGQSRYQIVQQPVFPSKSKMLNDRRGDLMLLINGMDKYLMTQKWLVKLVPNLRVCDMNRIAYQQLLNDYAEFHERQTTMDFHHQLKGAILDAVDEGLIERDPTRKAIIKGKPPVAKKIKYLNQFELHTLLISLDLKDKVNWDYFILLVAKTGMRFSEALALTPKDFDFAHQTLSISKTWDYKGKGGFQPTKNKSSVRKIQIDWQTVIQFSELVKHLPEDKPIFVNSTVYNSTVNDILGRHCKACNIPVISIHGLRHTHASLLLFTGVSIASVARRLGHSSMTTTQKTYLHIIQELENKDIDLVMRSLSGLS